jgi:hypothetical protein
MTVSELIEQLKSYPSDMRVLTLGYEGGLNDITVDCGSVVFGYKGNEAWYYGPHEFATNVDGATGTPCVIVGRDK